MPATATPSRLSLGRVSATREALDALNHASTHPLELLWRHATGDWGEVAPEDAATNALALGIGARVISRYALAATDQRIWIITEADRAATTLFLFFEY